MKGRARCRPDALANGRSRARARATTRTLLPTCSSTSAFTSALRRDPHHARASTTATGIWKVRFNPGEVGDWKAQLSSRGPHDPDFGTAASTSRSPTRDARGFLQRDARRRMGLPLRDRRARSSSSATPSTTSSACDYCGGDIEGFLRRRKEQGFNLLPHPPADQPLPPAGRHTSTGRPSACGPGAAASTAPRFDLFNLDWFRVGRRVGRG